MRKLNKIVSIVLLTILLTTNLAFAELDVSQNLKGALLGDLDTGDIFYDYNIDQKMEIASITKLMTYLVMRDAVESGQVSYEDDITISKYAAGTPGSSFGLKSGETLKLKDLIEPLLVVSGNDVATAIAEHVGGTEENFVEMMRKKAEEIGITTARFINPHGMPIDDAETDQNFMSIKDLFKLARHVLTKYPDIVDITSKEELVLPERNYHKYATNNLLPVMSQVDGLKTGYTHKAGLCLISTMPIIVKEDPNKNFRLIAIVMGAHNHKDRIDKSKELLEYGKKNYYVEKIIDKTELVESITVENAKEMKVDVYSASDFYKIIKNGTNIRVESVFNTEIKAPLKKGDIVGKMNVYKGEEKIGQTDLIIQRDVKKANFFVRIFRFFKNLFNK